MLDTWNKSYHQLRKHIKNQRHSFANKGSSSQSYGFSSSHIWIWKLYHKEGWAPKNWCFWTVVLETTFEIPLDCKEVKPVNSKGNQPWIFIGRADPEAKAPTLWPPDAKTWLIGKDLHAGKIWRQEEKGMTEEEMVEWHHQLDGMSLSKLWELVMGREASGAAVHGVSKSWTQPSDWTDWTRICINSSTFDRHRCWMLIFAFLWSIWILVQFDCSIHLFRLSIYT